MPLQGTYAGMSREEACGLEQIDLELSAETPYVLVQENRTKRLGFARYCEAVAKEGWEMIFSELYGEVNNERNFVRWTKAGGPKFYATT